MSARRPGPLPMTRAQLRQLEVEGRRRELAAALWRMRWRRLAALWVLFGQRLGGVVSPIILGAVYLTLFVPFGLIGRLAPRRRGWLGPRGRTSVMLGELKSQG